MRISGMRGREQTVGRLENKKETQTKTSGITQRRMRLKNVLEESYENWELSGMPVAGMARRKRFGARKSRGIIACENDMPDMVFALSEFVQIRFEQTV